MGRKNWTKLEKSRTKTMKVNKHIEKQEKSNN